MRRFRRLRGSEAMRRLVRETRISAEEMIYPVFVIEGENIKNPIPSMPGVFQYSVDRMDEMLAEVAASGIAGVLIFGIPKERMRLARRRMLRTASPREPFAISKRSIPLCLWLRMFAFANIPRMGIAA